MGKDGRCLRPTILPPSCAVFMKSGNLNFLAHSGPLQDCNGPALPFTFTLPHVSAVLLRHRQAETHQFVFGKYAMEEGDDVRLKSSTFPRRGRLTGSCLRAESHYTSRFRSVIVPSPFRQIDLCSHCLSCSVTFRHST